MLRLSEFKVNNVADRIAGLVTFLKAEEKRKQAYQII